MSSKQRAALVTAAVLAALPAQLVAQDAHAQDVPWRAFTSVNTVCVDDCDDSQRDQLFLNSGDRVHAWILRETSAFYLVTLHGEVRAVDKAKVTDVQRSDGARPSAEGHDDQVVLDSGHVLSGRIVAESELPPTVQILSADGRHTYVAHKPQISLVVRGGQVVPVQRTPAP